MTWVQLPVPTQPFVMTCNSGFIQFQGSGTLWWPVWPVNACGTTPPYMQAKHSDTWNKKKKHKNVNFANQKMVYRNTFCIVLAKAQKYWAQWRSLQVPGMYALQYHCLTGHGFCSQSYLMVQMSAGTPAITSPPRQQGERRKRCKPF